MSKKVILLLIVSIFLISFVNAREINCLYDQPFNLWKFNEGTGLITQESCYGYNGTLIGGMNWTTGTYGSAVEFNGVDSYIDAGNIFNQNMPEFSFSLWTNVSNLIAYQTMFQSGNYYTPEFVELIQINEGIGNDYALFMSVSSIGIKLIDDDEIHNIIGTFNGSDNGNATLYIDGIIINSVLTAQPQIDATANSLLFGGNYANGFILDGTLDDIAFFNRTLSFDEVREFSVGCNLSDVPVIISLPSDSPYLDVSSSNAIIVHPVTAIPIYAVKIKINNSIYNLANMGGNIFQIDLNITSEGDYPFEIFSYSSCPSFSTYSSTFFVRTPAYITFDLYKGKANETGIWNWFFSNRYKNDFAYLTAEFSTHSNNPTINDVQKYVIPMSYKSNYKTKVFHAPYSDGEAVLKIWDTSRKYDIRLVDGEISFVDSYSVPNITKLYGVNSYLGQFKFNGTQQYDIYLSANDLHPYRLLFNWGLIVIIVFIIVVCMVLAFTTPLGMIPLVFGILISGAFILFRIMMWWWTGS